MAERDPNISDMVNNSVWVKKPRHPVAEFFIELGLFIALMSGIVAFVMLVWALK